MELPMCPSHHFVSKQNVRSYKNIIKFNLKCDDHEFARLLFGNEVYLVRFLNDEFISTLSMLKMNIHMRAKEDFKEHFMPVSNQRKTYNDLQSLKKEYIFENSWKTIQEIIPTKIIGTNRNAKVLRNLIQLVVNSMRHQHILLNKIIEKWDFSAALWLNIPTTEAKKILWHILILLLNNVLAAMISLNFYVTTCKVDADDNKLHYFWKAQWQSYYDKKVSEMILTKVIKKSECLSLGKKIKFKSNPVQRKKIRLLIKEVPKLHLILKPNNDCRPIVRYRNDGQNPSEKYKMKEKFRFLRILTGKTCVKIETEFRNLYQKWSHSNKPKLYFVKTDLSNAFGSVNREKLLKIINKKHEIFQKTEVNLESKKKMSQQYKQMVLELQKPLLIRAGSTIFEWKRGLVQGYKYSPALSELYYSYMDQLYFSNHLNPKDNQIRLFTRVVDDYLYITDSLADAHLFLTALSNYQNVNYKKTVINFEHPRIKFSEEITFLGYNYNENLEVSRAKNVFVGQMCYKIALSTAISNIQKFLENRIGQSGIQVNAHLFNLVHNPEPLIWQHIFTTFCLSANKFCTILAILCDEKEMLNFLMVYKKRVVVKMSNAILDMLLKNPPVDYKFVYCINHFQNISWHALYLCAKGTPKCSGLIPLINIELAKTNCLFGKWRDHASGINSNGEPFRSAVKEICRRSDLRVIVRKFNYLPEGFECYNHRNHNNDK